MESAAGWPNSRREYARLWIAVALPRAWAWLEGVSLFVGLLALYLVKRHPSWEAVLTDLSWQVPLGVFVLVLVVRLLRAPYDIHTRVKSERDKFMALAERRQRNQDIADRLTKLLQDGIHNVANMTVDPNDLEEKLQFRRAAHGWLTELRATMTGCGCSRQELSAVTDFTAADIPDPASSGYPYPGHPAFAVEKAMFAMRLKALRRIINTYAETSTLS